MYRKRPNVLTSSPNTANHQNNLDGSVPEGSKPNDLYNSRLKRFRSMLGELYPRLLELPAYKNIIDAMNNHLGVDLTELETAYILYKVKAILDNPHSKKHGSRVSEYLNNGRDFEQIKPILDGLVTMRTNCFPNQPNEVVDELIASFDVAEVIKKVEDSTDYLQFFYSKYGKGVVDKYVAALKKEAPDLSQNDILYCLEFYLLPSKAKVVNKPKKSSVAGGSSKKSEGRSLSVDGLRKILIQKKKSHLRNLRKISSEGISEVLARKNAYLSKIKILRDDLTLDLDNVYTKLLCEKGDFSTMDELASIVKKFRVLIPDLTKDEAPYILYSVLCLKEKDFTIVRNLRFLRSIKGLGVNNQDCVNYVRHAVLNYYPNRVQDLGFSSADEFRVYIDNYLKLNSSTFSLLDKARFMEVCPLESANLFRIFISEIKNEYKNLTDFSPLELITIKSSLMTIRMIYKRNGVYNMESEVGIGRDDKGVDVLKNLIKAINATNQTVKLSRLDSNEPLGNSDLESVKVAVESQAILDLADDVWILESYKKQSNLAVFDCLKDADCNLSDKSFEELLAYLEETQDLRAIEALLELAVFDTSRELQMRKLRFSMKINLLKLKVSQVIDSLKRSYFRFMLGFISVTVLFACYKYLSTLGYSVADDVLVTELTDKVSNLNSVADVKDVISDFYGQIKQYLGGSGVTDSQEGLDLSVNESSEGLATQVVDEPEKNLVATDAIIPTREVEGVLDLADVKGKTFSVETSGPKLFMRDEEGEILRNKFGFTRGYKNGADLRLTGESYVHEIVEDNEKVLHRFYEVLRNGKATGRYISGKYLGLR